MTDEFDVELERSKVEPIPEMIQAYEDAAGECPFTDVAEGLAAAFAYRDRTIEIENSKLRGALALAGNSRELWRRRAIEAGWKPDRCGPNGHADPHRECGLE